ncbi:MAG TPA: hypothetical protein GX701_09385 [Clostridiales bacterium]|nr:hypothetical protein [Clostridiales bacterium]
MIYQLIRRIIGRGNYDKGVILEMLDVYRSFRRITEQEYAELAAWVGAHPGEG